MRQITIEPDEHKVLHSLTLQDLRTCELALAMLLKKRDLFGDDVVSRLHDTLDRLSDARVLCQVAAGQTYVRGDEGLNALHCVPQPPKRSA